MHLCGIFKFYTLSFINKNATNIHQFIHELKSDYETLNEVRSHEDGDVCTVCMFTFSFIFVVFLLLLRCCFFMLCTTDSVFVFLYLLACWTDRHLTHC